MAAHGDSLYSRQSTRYYTFFFYLFTFSHRSCESTCVPRIEHDCSGTAPAIGRPVSRDHWLFMPWIFDWPYVLWSGARVAQKLPSGRHSTANNRQWVFSFLPDPANTLQIPRQWVAKKIFVVSREWIGNTHRPAIVTLPFVLLPSQPHHKKHAYLTDTMVHGDASFKFCRRSATATCHDNADIDNNLYLCTITDKTSAWW